MKTFLISSFTVAVVMLIYRMLLPWLQKKYSVRALCVVWTFLAFSLLVPVRPALPLLPAQPGTAVSVPQRPVSVTAVPVKKPHAVTVQQASERAQTQPFSPETALTVVWLVGMAASVLYAVLHQHSFVKLVRHWSCPCEDTELLTLLEECRQQVGVRSAVRLYICSAVQSPMKMGLFQPVILLPKKKYQNEQYRFFFLHELTHHKNHDLWERFLVLTVSAIHWFNPAVYLMQQSLSELQELRCDAAVLKGTNLELRCQYTQTVLEVAKDCTCRKAALTTAFASNHNGLKSRVHNAMETDVKRRGTVCVACGLCAAILAGCTLVPASAGTSAAVRSVPEKPLVESAVSSWTFQPSTTKPAASSKPVLSSKPVVSSASAAHIALRKPKAAAVKRQSSSVPVSAASATSSTDTKAFSKEDSEPAQLSDYLKLTFSQLKKAYGPEVKYNYTSRNMINYSFYYLGSSLRFAFADTGSDISNSKPQAAYYYNYGNSSTVTAQGGLKVNLTYQQVQKVPGSKLCHSSIKNDPAAWEVMLPDNIRYSYVGSENAPPAGDAFAYRISVGLAE